MFPPCADPHSPRKPGGRPPEPGGGGGIAAMLSDASESRAMRGSTSEPSTRASMLSLTAHRGRTPSPRPGGEAWVSPAAGSHGELGADDSVQSLGEEFSMFELSEPPQPRATGSAREWGGGGAGEETPQNRLRKRKEKPTRLRSIPCSQNQLVGRSRLKGALRCGRGQLGLLHCPYPAVEPIVRGARAGGGAARHGDGDDYLGAMADMDDVLSLSLGHGEYALPWVPARVQPKHAPVTCARSSAALSPPPPLGYAARSSLQTESSLDDMLAELNL
jgi:hypothetical protein